MDVRHWREAIQVCAESTSETPGGHRTHFGGEFCRLPWRLGLRGESLDTTDAWTTMRSTVQAQERSQASEAAFATLWCALSEPFPLRPRDHTSPPPLASRGPDRRTSTAALPTLIALAMGGQDQRSRACPLITTAVARGWRVLLGTGEWHGYLAKFEGALKLVKLLEQWVWLPYQAQLHEL